ncbi:inositol-1-monophosphatase [Sulfolobus acidocaldarius SUSAZ]|nr:inositol-1-monophosphatase [Sulfolobus acidocaldarius SUSAZ]
MKKEDVEKVASEASKYIYEERENKDVDRVINVHGNDVTRIIDKKSEDFIVDRLKSLGYNMLIVTEESGVIDIYGKNYDYIAIVDPLDGSTNFVSGIPWSSVSIAIYNREEEDILSSNVGAVSSIFTPYTFSYDEESAYINGVKTAQIKKPEKILLLAYFSRSKLPNLKSFFEKIGQGYKIRSLGSASLDMILVCTGRATMFFDIRGKLRNVDIAASSNFCSRLGVIPYDVGLRKIKSSLTEVSVVKDLVISLDESLLRSFSLALQTA